MDKQPLDTTKPVRTRDGWPARIIATDKVGCYPIVALIASPGGGEGLRTFTRDGEHWLGKTSDFDLVNVPAKIDIEVEEGQDLSAAKATGT